MRTALFLFGFASAAFVGVMAGQMLSPGEAAPPDLADLERLRAQVDELETEVARLKVEARRPPPLPASMPGGPDLLDSSVAEAAAERPAAAPLPDEALRDTILEVVQEKEKTDRGAREERVAKYAARMEEARLDRLEKDLGLEKYQREELAKILEKRRVALADLWRGRREQPRSPEAREEMREELKRIREEADTELKKLLSTEQYEAFKKTDNQALRRRSQPRGNPLRGRGRR
ncbi:MAG: hypothetical protein ACYTDY_04370 [Planctomycetota bacterium]|jgi:hypothetical protein